MWGYFSSHLVDTSFKKYTLGQNFILKLLYQAAQRVRKHILTHIQGLLLYVLYCRSTADTSEKDKRSQRQFSQPFRLPRNSLQTLWLGPKLLNMPLITADIKRDGVLV